MDDTSPLKISPARRKIIDEANAEADKGVFISQEAMHAWMDTWDTDHETLPPEPDVFLKPRAPRQVP